MKITNTTKAIEVAYKSGDNVHIVGPHGIGKSEIVGQWAEKNGFHFEVLQLPILEVSDLIGMPDIIETKHGKITEWAAPAWVHRVKEANANGTPAVIFLDELGRASIDIRQASLQLVLEKRVNEHYFDDVVFVVADNPSEDYDSAEFDAALEDRFMSFTVEADITGWLSYARNNDVLAVVTDYLAEFPEKLHFTPETDGEKGSSPRAWKKLSDALKVNKDDDFVYSIITSKVGKTVGSNFYHFYNNYVDVVKPEDIVKALENEKLDTEADQKKAAKNLSKLTKDIEVVSAGELANKMLKMVEDKELDNEPLVVFIASLNKEVAAGILKTWKQDENFGKKWYLEGFLEGQPNKWYIRSLVNNIG